jgi:hypothetical protein
MISSYICRKKRKSISPQEQETTATRPLLQPSPSTWEKNNLRLSLGSVHHALSKTFLKPSMSIVNSSVAQRICERDRQRKHYAQDKLVSAGRGRSGEDKGEKSSDLGHQGRLNG